MSVWIPLFAEPLTIAEGYVFYANLTCLPSPRGEGAGVRGAG